MATSDSRIPRLLLAAFLGSALLYLVGIFLDAPPPWPWAGILATAALVGYAALGSTGAPRLARWSLAASGVLVAVWPVSMTSRGGPTHLEVYLSPAARVPAPAGGLTSSPVDALWQGLLRTGPLLLTVACLALALGTVAMSKAGRPRLGRAGVIAAAGAVLGLGYEYLAIGHRAASAVDRSVMLQYLTAAASGDMLLLLAAVAIAAIAAARGMWYSVAGMALLAGYAVAGLAGTLDQAQLDWWSARVPPGNISAAELFLEPGIVYAGQSPAPVGPVLHTALGLAGLALAIVGCVRAARPGRRATPSDVG